MSISFAHTNTAIAGIFECTLGVCTLDVIITLYTTQQAIHDSNYYPSYVWITFGWYGKEWWKDEEEYLRSINCSSSDVVTALNRSLALQPHPFTVRNSTGKFI